MKRKALVFVVLFYSHASLADFDVMESIVIDNQINTAIQMDHILHQPLTVVPVQPDVQTTNDKVGEVDLPDKIKQ